MTQTTKVKGWIGQPTWAKRPLSVTDSTGEQFGALFQTKKDAIAAGWNKPVRVEVTVRVL